MVERQYVINKYIYCVDGLCNEMSATQIIQYDNWIGEHLDGSVYNLFEIMPRKKPEENEKTT